jgi:hypothetical protein
MPRPISATHDFTARIYDTVEWREADVKVGP